MKEKQLTFSQWCDEIKFIHSKCVDEKQTKLDFLTNNLIGYFMDVRGCSWLVASGYAKEHLKSVYEEISDRVNKNS